MNRPSSRKPSRILENVMGVIVVMISIIWDCCVEMSLTIYRVFKRNDVQNDSKSVEDWSSEESLDSKSFLSPGVYSQENDVSDDSVSDERVAKILGHMNEDGEWIDQNNTKRRDVCWDSNDDHYDDEYQSTEGWHTGPDGHYKIEQSFRKNDENEDKYGHDQGGSYLRNGPSGESSNDSNQNEESDESDESKEKTNNWQEKFAGWLP